MEINRLQGSMAYINVPNATPQNDNTLIRDRNNEPSGTDPNTGNTPAAPNTFQVTLTREAQDRLAAEATKAPILTQPPKDQTNQNMVSAYETSQIVNIVA